MGSFTESKRAEIFRPAHWRHVDSRREAGHDGAPACGIDEHILATKFEKSLRETLNPLISLKTAKSGRFRRQRYQALSKTNDFASETIWLRFGCFAPRPKSRRRGIAHIDAVAERVRREAPLMLKPELWREARSASASEVASKIWKTGQLKQKAFLAP
jgi:hypothetical protein